MKRQKLTFRISFEVDRLVAVPFKTGTFFCKVKGSPLKAAETRREAVLQHEVRWAQAFSFDCKMTVGEDGILEPFEIVVSVRKEVKGGKSYEKIGSAIVDLAEYAGKGEVERRYLLRASRKDARQDNSLLTVRVQASLVEGVPIFKARETSEADAADAEEDALTSIEGQRLSRRLSLQQSSTSATEIVQEIFETTSLDSGSTTSGSGIDSVGGSLRLSDLEHAPVLGYD